MTSFIALALQGAAITLGIVGAVLCALGGLILVLSAVHAIGKGLAR